MRLNWLGRATMNNAARRLGQYYTAYWLEWLGGRVLGCGCGTGVRIILERFGAPAVEALDLDPKMIDRARRHLGGYGLARVQLSVGDVTAIKSGDATFDAVFDFGTIHLEPNWRKALAEVRRNAVDRSWPFSRHGGGAAVRQIIEQPAF